MLVNLKEILEIAEQEKNAVGMFNATGFDSLQAVIGAVMGIGIAKGGRNLNWKLIGHIAVSWISTPIIAALVCYISLFFLQNVFDLKVYQ